MFLARLRKGMSIEKALIVPKRSRKVKDHLGNEFSSKKAMLDFYKIGFTVFQARIKKGWSLKDALTVPRRSARGGNFREELWNEYFFLLREFYEEYGTYNVPTKYEVFKEGKKYTLGQWVYTQRKHYREDIDKPIYFNRIKKLNEINFNWIAPKTNQESLPEIFIRNFIKKYFKKAGKGYISKFEYDILVPGMFAIEYNGQAWHKDKSARDKRKQQICKRNSLSFYRIVENQKPSNNNIKRYKNTFYVSYSDYASLEEVICIILRENGIENPVCPKKCLEKSICAKNGLSENWIKNLNLCLEYEKINKVVPRTVYKRIKIGGWLHYQRQKYKHNLLSEEKVNLLEKSGLLQGKKKNFQKVQT